MSAKSWGMNSTVETEASQNDGRGDGPSLGRISPDELVEDWLIVRLLP